MDKIYAINPVLIGTTKRPTDFTELGIVPIDSMGASSQWPYYIHHPLLSKSGNTIQSNIEDGIGIVTTESLYSNMFNGIIEGNIFMNTVGNSYQGEIILSYEGTDTILIRRLVDSSGHFKIENLNPKLKYSVKCVPADNTTYKSKIINNVAPHIDIDKTLDIIDIDKTILKADISSYTHIIKILNYTGTIFVSVINADWLSINDNGNGIFVLKGIPPVNNISYIINCRDIYNNTEKGYSKEYNFTLM